MRGAYYNEIDRKAAAWLRELIRRGLIADGDVDERSIVDVRATDLVGYAQCHFFAGIGGWSYALRLAGWPDDRPVWTGSCPCQPFSVAGKAGGVGDERHLWPAFRTLIAECRPAIAFGEQVASADGRLWLAGVRTDLENLGYAVGAADLCAAGVGAPHIRQRLYWVADSSSEGLERSTRSILQAGDSRSSGDRTDGRLADAQVGGLGADGGAPRDGGHADECGQAGGMGDAHTRRLKELRGAVPVSQTDPRQTQVGWAELRGSYGKPWGGCDWLPCLDGKARRIEPGIAPLAHGVPARVVRLRGYGNAIVAPLAAEFVRAATEAIGDSSP